MFNKKATLGETITWVVATVIIIVILMISILAATSYLGKNKGAGFSAKRSDLLASKSFFAYVLTENETGQTVHEQLKNKENLNDFNGNLAIKIFDGFYGKEYLDVWVGLVPLGIVPEYYMALSHTKNKYFGADPSNLVGGTYSWEATIKIPHISQRIPLNENKSVDLILTNG